MYITGLVVQYDVYYRIGGVRSVRGDVALPHATMYIHANPVRPAVLGAGATTQHYPHQDLRLSECPSHISSERIRFWLPMTAFTVLMELNPRAITSPKTIYLVFSVCHLVAMSSTVTNPLLYGWLNTNFRRELGSVLGRILPRFNQVGPPARPGHSGLH
ncbi:hypothetical protein J6590_038971 [Homalodisca vitripennis]|nr:hypothetical protein J6590_038971 [Homalodisca vitripennis]